MLEELRIRGLGVIDEAVLPLGPGLTVVTGETGAGKTMVVTGLLLMFGGRADAARVRAGAGEAVVDGRVRVEPGSRPAARVSDAGGTVDDDGTLILRRVVTAQGRSRAYVGGAPAPIGVLAELAEDLLTVHGQADQLRLGRPGEQRAALDRFAGSDPGRFAAAFQAWRAANDRLTERSARARELRREADLLRHGVDEIAAAAPQSGEDLELAAAASRLAHADGLRLAARSAHDALLGDSDDLGGETADVGVLLGRAARALSQVAGEDPELDALASRLADLAAESADLGADLSAYADRLDADPHRLAEIEQRRAVLARLTRKYADDLTGVIAWAREAEQRLAELDLSGEALAALAVVRDAAARDAAELAGELSIVRTTAAGELADAVTRELAGLAMPTARLHIEVRPRPAVAGSAVLTVAGSEVAATSDGVDEVAFLLQPRTDAPALPVQRGASGGELSRVMLGVEVCLAGSDPVPTMVFDEVDAGVGGRAAVEVGRRLARLARDHQVIVVTHLPQVAAYAHRHVVVDRPVAGVTSSDVRIVAGKDRIAEITRMLAGRDSRTAREHAAELLAAAEADTAECLVEADSQPTGRAARSR
ncbi:MAG: DNA repair protein RecN [Actinomycetota bacterium]